MASALSLAVMMLWNFILVPVTGVKVVTFWQAAGLLLLSKILFGGFRGGPPWRKRWKGHGPTHHWRERWKNMSDEDRAKLKARWKERWKE